MGWRINLSYMFGSVLILSGCVTQYSYTPPTTPQGQQCVAKCERQQQACKIREDERVAIEKPQCERDADVEYIACLKYAKTEKDKDACYRSSCYVSPNYYACDNDFRQCFQVCGGTVGVLK